MGRSRRHYYRDRSRARAILKTFAVLAVVVVLGVIAWVVAALTSSPGTPSLALTVAPEQTAPGAPLRLTAPPGVQEVVGLDGLGTMAEAGVEQPHPIASMTKMMAALVVLRDHPLSPYSNGPEIQVTPADVATYQSDKRQGDSVVPVVAGEKLTERQALEAALIPSGDNIVEMLADWDAGSVPAFVAKMNAMARSLGLAHTHYAGPSGVNPATVSTAHDQLVVAEAAMRIPAFAHIVAMPQATLPVAGVVYNVDSDLGHANIDGIKTGWIPASGACFAFSAPEKVSGYQVRLTGVVIGEQGGTPLASALAAAVQIVTSASKALRVVTVPAGTTVARLSAPWSHSIRVVTTSLIRLVAWNGARLDMRLTPLHRLPSTLSRGAVVGTLTVQIGQARMVTRIETTAPLQGPSLGWRLSHP